MTEIIAFLDFLKSQQTGIIIAGIFGILIYYLLRLLKKNIDFSLDKKIEDQIEGNSKQIRTEIERLKEKIHQLEIDILRK